MDGGTLYQLRNLLMRRSVTSKIKSDPTACEDFFILVVKAHILTVVMEKFGLKSFDDTPSNDRFGNQFLEGTPAQRTTIFREAVKEIVKEFTNDIKIESVIGEKDHVLAYAKELLTLGLLYLEFVDSIHEGDGYRILRCWKYFLLTFKATNKRKYAIQASTLLLQYYFIFSERMKKQLLWSRTVNRSGRPGRNIPMDLEMEHLNRELKGAISNLHSNVNENSIARIGRSLKKLVTVTENYDKCSDIPLQSNYHSSRSNIKDLTSVVEELQKSNVYIEQSNREHSQFPKFKGNIAGTLKCEDIESWLKAQLKRLLNKT